MSHTKITKKKELVLEVLRETAFALQVCTNAKRKSDIEHLANSKSLCGTSLGWVLDERESKRLGQSAVECSEHKDRKHYILYA